MCCWVARRSIVLAIKLHDQNARECSFGQNAENLRAAQSDTIFTQLTPGHTKQRLRRYSPTSPTCGSHSQAAPRTPLESPCIAFSTGVSTPPPKV